MPSLLAESDATQTLNASALTQLRSDIIACRLMPNERLRVEALRERYGMGTSPIREALMRLEAEGLVELEQNKGFRVSEVSRENLLDLMHTRIEIENIALRWSIEKGDVEWEANLLSAFHRLSRQSKIDPVNTRRPQRSLEQGTCGFSYRISICMRGPDPPFYPFASFRTGRALRRLVDYVEQPASR